MPPWKRYVTFDDHVGNPAGIPSGVAPLDGAGLVPQLNLAPSVIGVTVFLAGGNFNPTARTRAALIRGVGAGGGGGGSLSLPGGAAAGGGGASGAFLEFWLFPPFVAPYAVVIGVPGLGGPPGVAGGAGGATTFGPAGPGQLIFVPGGGGVGGANVAAPGDGYTGEGVGGPAAGGDVNGNGSRGHPGLVLAGALGIGGSGGSSLWGSGGPSVLNGPGIAAAGFGGGGGGAGDVGGLGAVGGGGGPALIVVHEFE